VKVAPPVPVPVAGLGVVLGVGYGAGGLAGVDEAGGGGGGAEDSVEEEDEDVDEVEDELGVGVVVGLVFSVLGGAGLVLKPGGSVTPLARAQVSGSSPSGQQYPFVRQKLPAGHASVVM
jgi:hypothetical protein